MLLLGDYTNCMVKPIPGLIRAGECLTGDFPLSCSGGQFRYRKSGEVCE